MGTRRIGTCTLCEAACGITLEIEGRRVESVRGDADDPMSRGYVCPKVIGMKDLHEDPDRLRAPLVRDGSGELREASWEEALERAATGLCTARRTHGRDALAIYQGNPAAHNFGLLTVGQIVLRSFRTRNLYSASSADQAPHMLAAHAMFGNAVLMPVPDLERTDLLLVLGANPLVSNGSIMTAPDMRARLARIRERGGRVVVVDPRRTETAARADEHVFIRPGTDPAWLFAVLATLFEEGLAHPARLGLLSRGADELEALARRFTPERVAAFTGVDAETTRRIARELGRTPRAAIYGRVGICHQRHGTLASWLTYALAAVTGNLDRPGGTMWTTPAVDVPKLAKVLGLNSYGRFASRVRGLEELGGELPIATLADEIETPGKGQVRALLTCAGNPVLSAPNGERIARALSGLDFMVSVDAFVNETTRHAHVILPPVSPLERSHYDVALNAFAVENFAKYVPAPIAPLPGEKQDWEILLELALRTRLDGGAVGRAARAALHRGLAKIGPEGLLDGLLRTGPHGVRDRSEAGGLTLAKLRAAPHGIMLGPLEPRLPGILETSHGKVDLAPAAFVREVPALEADLDAAAAPGTLVLIGRRQLRGNNSWMHNSHALTKGPERCTLLMHPGDAEARGLASGALALLETRVGAITVPLEVSDEVMPGVVSLPHGFGHSRPGVRLTIAAQRPGASLNDLTDDTRLDRLTGNAAFSGTPVRVRAAGAPVARAAAPR